MQREPDETPSASGSNAGETDPKDEVAATDDDSVVEEEVETWTEGGLAEEGAAEEVVEEGEEEEVGGGFAYDRKGPKASEDRRHHKGRRGRTVRPIGEVIQRGWGEGLWAVVIVDLVAVLIALWLIFEQPGGFIPGAAFAGALVIVVFVTFGGVFARTGTVRTALGVTLFLTYVVLAIFLLNITAFAEHVEKFRLPEEVFQTLTAAFTTVLVFYFGSEAYVVATSIREKQKTKRSQGGGTRKVTRTIRPKARDGK